MKKAKKKAQPKTPTTPKALALTPEYRETMKFEKWCEHFFNKGDKETYLNATKSALRVYNTEKYFNAAAIGHQNYKKLQNLRATIADAEGFGVGEYIKIAIAKAMAGDYSDWQELGIQLGHFDADPKASQAPTVQNNTINFNFASIQEAIIASRKERGLKP